MQRSVHWGSIYGKNPGRRKLLEDMLPEGYSYKVEEFHPIFESHQFYLHSFFSPLLHWSWYVILFITDFGHQIPRVEAIGISPLRYIIYHGFWPSDSAGRRYRYRYVSSQVYYLSRIGISRYLRELSISLRKILNIEYSL